MGAYLSSPVTEKISSDKACTGFTYGASCMQGWRISQEDAHNCLPDFDPDRSASLFAVYDGHGGAEVAQYCARYLPDCIKDTEQYKQGELGQALVEAFLKFDAKLVEEDVVKELKALAGEDENEEEDDEDDPVGRGEADVLRAEADLPLDELLAKYQNITETRVERKREAFQSPAIRAKADGAGSSKTVDGEIAPGASKDSASDASDNIDGPSSSRFVDRLTNGLADNENNLNKERELQDSQKTESGEKDVSSDASSATDAAPLGTKNNDSDGPVSTDSKDSGVAGVSSSKDITDTADSAATSGSSSSSAPCGSSSGVSSSTSSGQSASSLSGAAEESPSKADDQPSGSSSSATDDADEAGPSGSGCSGSGAGGSGTGKSGPSASFEEDMDDSDDDDDDPDEEYEWQEDDSEEEEDEEEDDVEGMDENDDGPTMDMSNEEPGSDSGCTACVVLLCKNQLVVANAGDSRCVLCRNGKAVDLSIDHKPEDECERTRIEKAGGKVTADGRVNGGLNLSRALGDHCYKRKEELPPEEQMITALPDIKEMTVEPDDQFFIVACDGIWNYMSSQEVTDFVAEQLKDPEKRKKPSLICEELFDHCLAPNTLGDGTGCDNMTCIIVVFNSDGTSCTGGDCVQPSKRCAGDLDNTAENTEKRPRVEDDGSAVNTKKSDTEAASGDA